jgi:hypothetical protein
VTAKTTVQTDLFNKAVVFLEDQSFEALPDLGTLKAIVGPSADSVVVSTPESAIAVIRESKVHVPIVVSNRPELRVFEASRKKDRSIQNILVTSKTIFDYAEPLAHRDGDLLDHVIANHSQEWTIRDLRITCQKILRGDVFGLEKYLDVGTPIQRAQVTGTKDRDQLNQTVSRWAESCGVGKNIGRLVYGITEELLMNAIYDAPVAGGRTHYETLDRAAARNLQPDEFSTLSYGTDTRTLALSIADPFGAFVAPKFWQYARKILRRDDPDGLIDTKKGGAGLGLFKMLYSSHGVICNVATDQKTEVIVLIDLAAPVRDFSSMPRSMHYFLSPQKNAPAQKES